MIWEQWCKEEERSIHRHINWAIQNRTNWIIGLILINSLGYAAVWFIFSFSFSNVAEFLIGLTTGSVIAGLASVVSIIYGPASKPMYPEEKE